MTHILIPREPNPALLRPFIGCPEGQLPEAWAAMMRAAEVQNARAGCSCLAQIQEPAQPVAEICSASGDGAEFGERSIKLLCDISDFEYGTPLYAGAIPTSTVDDMAALVKQLVQALRKAAPNHALPAKALDYLRRQDLLGSPLRSPSSTGPLPSAKET